MKPFTYRGNKTREIRFPLGGIGSGCIGLDGTGHLVDWELFNRPAKGSWNGFSHFAVKAEADGKVLDARVLHGGVPPPYGGTGNQFGFGVARETLSGLPHFRQMERAHLLRLLGSEAGPCVRYPLRHAGNMEKLLCHAVS